MADWLRAIPGDRFFHYPADALLCMNAEKCNNYWLYEQLQSLQQHLQAESAALLMLNCRNLMIVCCCVTVLPARLLRTWAHGRLFIMPLSSTDVSGVFQLQFAHVYELNSFCMRFKPCACCGRVTSESSPWQARRLNSSLVAAPVLFCPRSYYYSSQHRFLYLLQVVSLFDGYS